jgi:hypothetical protein
METGDTNPESSGAATSHDAALTWVVVDGDLREVSEFASLPPRDRPLAFCPQCDRRIILKLGKVRAHHAAHRAQDICAATAAETALHLNAKFHLASQLRQVTTISLREKCQNQECDQVRQREWAASWDAVDVERRVGTRRPDVTLFRGGAAVAAVEVFATHAVDDEKARVLADAQIPWVEVRAIEVLEGAAWTPAKPLPVHKEGPHQPWHCDACAKAQSERAAAHAAAQANGGFSICARLVDFFFRSGKKLRTVYEILEERADGRVVAVILRAWRGDQQARFEGGKAENKLRVQREFATWMQGFKSRGAIVDSPMAWAVHGAHWFSSELVAYSDIYYPRRYRWDAGARCWRILPGRGSLRWRDK